jgi:hypothetical protein
MVFSCHRCNEEFLNERNLKYHHASIKCIPNFICKPCNKTFANKQSLITHQNSKIHSKVSPNNFTVKQIENNDRTVVNNGYDNTGVILTVNFGSEDCDKLKNSQIIEIINKYSKTPDVFAEIIKLIHFSKSTPEHHNIFIKNKRLQQIHVRQNDAWVIREKEFAKYITENLAKYLKSNWITYYTEFYKGSKFITKSRLEKLKDDIYTVTGSRDTFAKNKLINECSKNIIKTCFENREKCTNL